MQSKLLKRLQWLQNQVQSISNKYDTSSEIIAEILKLNASPQWQQIAGIEAHRMVKEAAVLNAQTWRRAARQARKGSVISRVLSQEILTNQQFKQLIARNTTLIQTIPNTVAKHLVSQITTAVANGERVEFVLKDLPPHINSVVMRRIVRTETAKTQAAITQIRAGQVGVDLYVWRTVHDQRVRGSHAHMDGVICSYKNPPSPEALDGKESIGFYNPGEVWNCRCYADPIIDPMFLDAPYRIAENSQIHRISKKDLLSYF